VIILEALKIPLAKSGEADVPPPAILIFALAKLGPGIPVILNVLATKFCPYDVIDFGGFDLPVNVYVAMQFAPSVTTAVTPAVCEKIASTGVKFPEPPEL
jgi:membrane-associated PAP2 superfamily phosphatase